MLEEVCALRSLRDSTVCVASEGEAVGGHGAGTHSHHHHALRVSAEVSKRLLEKPQSLQLPHSIGKKREQNRIPESPQARQILCVGGEPSGHSEAIFHGDGNDVFGDELLENGPEG